MSWRFHGRAHVSTTSPEAFAVCDRCNNWYNRSALRWQFQFAGPNLQNIRLLVCDRCYDVPQPQLKPRILPPDPLPVLNARPEYFQIDDSDWITAQTGQFLITQGGQRLVTQNSSNQRPPSN